MLLPGASIALELIAGYDGPGATLTRQTVSADANGEYALAIPPPESAVRVRAQGNLSGYLCFPSETLVLRGADAPSQLDVHCYPLDLQVRGRVHDPDGNPIRGAHVQGHMAPVDTDAEGRFELQNSSALQELTLCAWAEGYAEQRASVLANEPGVAEGVEIELRRSAVLRGRILDADGSAIPDAQVRGFPIGHVRALSDAAGRFTLTGLPTDAHWLTLRIQAAGFAGLRHDLEQGRIPSDELTIVLQRGVELAGQVLDGSGQPLPGAEVVAGSSRSDIDALSTVAGDEGRFSFACLPRATRDLIVEAAGCAPHHQLLALPESGRADPLRIVLEHGLTLHGIVVDAQQRELPDFDVYVRRDQEYIENAGTKTGADGRFTLQSLPKTGLVLEVLGPGFVRAKKDCDPSTPNELRIVMQRAAGLAGRVTDAASGKPVTAFRVRLLRGTLEPGEQPASDYSGTWSEGREIRDPEGRWNTNGEMLTPGAVTGLEICAPGYGPALVDRAIARLDPEQQPIVVALTAGATVHGHVLDARNGAPIAHARVRRMRLPDVATSWDGWDARSDPATETDADGNFVFEGLALESMTLAIEAPGFASRIDGPFEPDAHTTRTVELAAGATLRGVLRDRAGHALAHEPVMVSGSGGELGKLYRTWQFETDGEGRFELGDLMPATYSSSRLLKYESGSVGDLGQNVTITEARVYEVELRPRGSGSVSGTIQVRGGAAPLLTIMANRTDAPAGQVAWRSAIARDGRFQIEGMEPGRWHFSTWEPGTQSSRAGSADADVAATGETNVEIELLER
jgi:protocatechuate 3,4-dioxygenase beta subunit